MKRLWTILFGLALGFTPRPGFARSKSSAIQFGMSRGITFYTAPTLSSFNERLGNSPRLNAAHEFGRATTTAAHIQWMNPTESAGWGFEAQQWSETQRGEATDGSEQPRSESSLAFIRLWMTGGVRLWPWVGPVLIRRGNTLLGRGIILNKARPLGSGFFSHLNLGAGALLWRHNFFLSDEANQTSIDYSSRTLSWDTGARLSLGWRLGRFCDLGFDVFANVSRPLKSEFAIGNVYVTGRNQSDKGDVLGVETLANSTWRSLQASVFIRFFSL